MRCQKTLVLNSGAECSPGAGPANFQKTVHCVPVQSVEYWDEYSSSHLVINRSLQSPPPAIHILKVKIFSWDLCWCPAVVGGGYVWSWRYQTVGPYLLIDLDTENEPGPATGGQLLVVVLSSELVGYNYCGLVLCSWAKSMKTFWSPPPVSVTDKSYYSHYSLLSISPTISPASQFLFYSHWRHQSIRLEYHPSSWLSSLQHLGHRN